MDIEQELTSAEKLRQGIFFTADSIVREIIGRFRWRGDEAIIDSAAGDGAFLTALAASYPQMQLFAIEKNKKVYRAGKEKTAGIPNIRWFHGDNLLETFPIPPCDAYLGNPPFINFSDLETDYAEKLKILWKKYFTLPPGFRQLLGSSRGDIAQLFFYHTVETYLKADGKIGVVLPESLLFGSEASRGFREFNNIAVEECVDISDRNPFRFTQRNCFYIVARKGGSTDFPISYRKSKNRIRLYPTDHGFSEQKEDIRISDYIPRQGINTLGANSVFFFKGSRPFESELFHPLLKSSDIMPFGFKTSYAVLLPYGPSGQILSEEDLKTSYPEAWSWLLANKDNLKNRKSRFARKHWYGLFGIGAYTFAPFKVVWKALGAQKLEAAVVCGAIPNQAMHAYIAAESAAEAHYLCALLNSIAMNDRVKLLSRPGAKSFALPSVIRNCGIPRYDTGNRYHQFLADYSSRRHQEIGNIPEKEWQTAAEQILSAGIGSENQTG